MLPIMALLAILAVSGAALAVDVARAHAVRNQLQLTADAAALAAAINLPDMDAARKAAHRYAARNMPNHSLLIGSDAIEFGHWNPDTRNIEPDKVAPSAVRVTPSLSAEKGNALLTLFAGVLGSDRLDVSASAVAGKRSPICILALEPEKADALGMDIAANIEALNCTVQVNSRDRWAFRIWLGSQFLASGLCVTGNVYVSLLSRVTPEPTIGCPPQPDPLAGLQPPETAGCDFSDTILSGHHGILHPGVYCGGLIIDGASRVELAAGVYVIKDGPLAIGDSSEVSGDGITFYLTGEKSLIRFHDDSQLTLTAPTDGDLAGILVFQDRNFGGDHIWDSNAPTTLHGTVYLPEGRLLSESSNAITPVGSCNVLIAKSLRLKLHSAISIDLGQKHCQSYLPAAVLGTVALLE
ncbi:MAG: TadG family pilus assembly protein [Geminicoccaceae bacterium]